MNKLKFIHTADIHLGSFLHIGGETLPPSVDKAIETATLEGFSRVCHAAIVNGVDFMVISGDLFDREARSVKAMSYFVEQCKALNDKGIDLFIIAGNHDPLREQPDLFEMPSNVKVFRGDQPEVFMVLDKDQVPIARIIGQSYQNRWEQREIHLNYKPLDTDLWNIALLHTQLEAGSSKYIPCSIGDLKGRQDIHYWALGHIHQPGILNQASPYIVYPGIPQGRDFGEQDRGGCVLVELNPFGDSTISFIPLAPVVYKRIDIFIDSDEENLPESLPELEDMISQQADRLLEDAEKNDNYPVKGYVVEWILRGRGAIHNSIKEQEHESLHLLTESLRMRYEGISPFLWTQSVILRTRPPVDYGGLVKNNPVFDELDNIIRQCLDDGAMKAKLIKELGDIWAGDSDHESSDDFRFHMDQATLEEIVSTAKQLILEKWAEGRERQ